MSIVSVQGTFGPFVPASAVEVPLWFAVTLRKRSRCSIAPPNWLELDALTQVLAAEQAEAEAFQALPYHYVEVCTTSERHVSNALRVARSLPLPLPFLFRFLFRSDCVAAFRLRRR